MKNNQLPDKCAVNRDLMPLCIDGTASEASRRKVRKHVAECPPCATVYQEMQTSVDLDVPDETEQQQFDTAVKKVRHKHTRRKLTAVLSGVVLALLVCAAAAYGYYWYWVEEVPVDVSSYSMELVRHKSEDKIPVFIRVTNMPRKARVSIQVKEEGRTLGTDNQLQPYRKMYIWVYATRETIAKNGTCDMDYYAFDMAGENLWAFADGVYEIKSIVQGAPGNTGKVLYADGDQLKWNASDLILYNVDRWNITVSESLSLTPVPAAQDSTPTLQPAKKSCKEQDYVVD